MLTSSKALRKMGQRSIFLLSYFVVDKLFYFLFQHRKMFVKDRPNIFIRDIIIRMNYLIS